MRYANDEEERDLIAEMVQHCLELEHVLANRVDLSLNNPSDVSNELGKLQNGLDLLFRNTTDVGKT